MIAIIGVGVGYEHQLEYLTRFPETLHEQKYIFDMQSFPERGDAVDVIEKGNLHFIAIFAFHLFGIGSDNPRMVSLNRDYFYNKRNHELLTIAKAKNISLFILGDQPSHPFKKDHGANWKEY